MQTRKITISTLSPVHIGCGMDYEPTNYVMDDDCLYPFPWIDEAAFATEEQLKNLLAQAGSIQGLWKIFHSELHLSTMKSLAGRFLPMKSGIKEKQESGKGKAKRNYETAEHDCKRKTGNTENN